MPQKNNLRNYWIGWVNQNEQDENYPLYKTIYMLVQIGGENIKKYN